MWTAIFQVVFGVAGTFVLQRLPTSFGIGFFLGCVLLAANQNIVIFASFRFFYTPGSSSVKTVFSVLALIIAFVYLSFVALLIHCREFVIESKQQPGHSMDSIAEIDPDFSDPTGSFKAFDGASLWRSMHDSSSQLSVNIHTSWACN